MMTINAMATGMSHSHRPPGHGAFELDHFPRRIARARNFACLMIDTRSLKLDERWRFQNSRKGVLECLCVIVDVAMQGSGNIVPIEHALLIADQRQNLFRLLADQFGILPCCLVIQPPALDCHSLLAHLRRMHAHMLGRRQLKAALRM
ncbi:hypothetical protein D3C86_1772870 [compost metagenome]